jgi:maleylacetate reductase
MTPFRGQFVLPRLERVISGAGTIAALPGELDRYGCSRAVVVTGATLGASPQLHQVVTTLEHRCAAVFAGSRQHVPSSTVAALLDAMRDVDADCLVSFGGGSPIDTAKAAVHAIVSTAGARDAGGAGAGPVHISIPTTLSAGEFTDVAGITDEATRIKHAVFDPRLAARTVIIDPNMTLGTPDWLWAASGVRALDHAVESLYSSRHHPISDPLAAQAIEVLVAHLPPSLSAAGEAKLEHRSECQMAAWLAVFGVTNAGFGLSHVLGHQIGPRWNVPHGMTSAIILPHAMRFMAEAAPERFAAIARGFGIPFDTARPERAARQCIDRAAAFIAALGLPMRLREVSVPREELHDIAGFVAELMERAAVVPRRVTTDDVAGVLAAAY